MIASIDLTDRELGDLKELTDQEDATAAVRIAMTEYLRYARRMRLKELSGRVTMEENWQSLESAEVESGDGSRSD